ncbi:ATP-binding protein [Microcoleus sp. FACHB-SPT15]|uniref:ATP-binding protein n=1 Tax=Microcoleus sp. FACHB-SPT15 TaxID=2692830 RepID=UPI0017827F0C|nr:ATP-binding protein [Microcoleus sp. FACHB-SPT15]MBD1806430.1 ATP-binding protein [Microcoleus sp. FACHB-SPT15]
MTMSIGFVLGTLEATPLEFWVAVSPGHVLRLDDVVEVQTHRPDGEGVVRFYGVVDYVRTMYEGAQFDTDTFLVKSGSLPANISYAAHVQVTRIEPEEYLPPQPGDSVNLAVDEDLKRALHFDGMEKRIPAGTMRNSFPAYLNYEFINGEKGAHINISGVSGVATKTSYALFLLHSIFNSAALGAQRANTKALIFNVKGEDLFFLDKSNSKLRSEDYTSYQTLGVPVEAFKDVRFCAAPRKGSHDVDPHLDQRPDNISVYLWSIRELCRDRLFSFLFAGEDLERGNLGFLVAGVEEKLARLAEDNDRADKKANRKPGVHLEVEPFGALDKQEVETFRDLIEFLEDKLVDNPDNSWLGRNAASTAEALIRRLWGINNEIGHLIRGDLSPERMTKYQLDPLSDAHRLTVVDINKLGGKAQKFVVGVLLQKLFSEKEKRGQNPVVFIVLDELNKYAPREGRSPIKSLLVEIAERGRSLGIILIGAQQTASEVERRVVGQAAIRVVGRLDSAEAERPEYNFLTGACRKRSLLLKSGSMFVHQPEVPAPLLINFPFPAYATRESEASRTEAEIAQIEDDLDRF